MKISLATTLALVSAINAQTTAPAVPVVQLPACGSGTPDITVSGSNPYRATRAGGASVYSGGDLGQAINTALRSINSGQRVSVLSSGSIGSTVIAVGSGKTFESCGVLNVTPARSGSGNVESKNTVGAKINYLTLTGTSGFALHHYGVRDLYLGNIVLNVTRGIGIRFDRDNPPNNNVVMNSIRCNGPSSHCVETWKIYGLQIGEVVARNVGESGLLIQNGTNTRVGYVEGDNVGRGTGYGTLRFANQNGLRSGSYNTNIFIDRVRSRGGGRGFFCVSRSGAAVINNLDLANNGNNAILIENCYNIRINGGTINGGGEVRVSARTEFPNTRDLDITLRVDGTTVRESPCATNSRWTLTGSGSRDICA
ncbi:parallel beta-helix repeat protein [Paraphoma chrysanthemicola]|uniref:Parallel beta-helix repeat protein n=1 Tax=Paraphoma chrysanthemicola TaxID=798071 RepID=A0A8K0VYB7_9PLEO|nr:parallel beta-helix repeat protein [Paraphoma chrysanthemicola]